MEIKKIPKNKFPKALLEIPQPPEDLWIIGDLPKENLIYLCVVGSRKNTTYGKEACEKIIDEVNSPSSIVHVKNSSIIAKHLNADLVSHQSQIDSVKNNEYDNDDEEVLI